MFQRYFQHLGLAKRLALLSTCLCLGACLLLVVVSNLSSKHVLKEQQKLYGQTLAEQLALRASESLINNDRVSLQAILTQYVQSTPVAMGTIYNVLRQPVAKAGKTAPGNINYSSPISVEGNIAGYAVVSQQSSSIDSSRQGIIISLIILSGLAALFNFGVIVRSGQALVYRLNKITFALHSKQALPEQEVSHWQDEIEILRQAVKRLPLEQLSPSEGLFYQHQDIQGGSLLYIHLTNLKTYRSQLGASALEDYTKLLQTALTHIAQLYCAKVSSCRECSAVMVFEGEQASGNACFRAASAAWLLRSVLSELETQYHLKLGTEMAATEISALSSDDFDLYLSLKKEELIDRLANYCKQQANKILLTDSCVTDCGDKLTTDTTDTSSLHELTGFSRFENSALRHQQIAMVKQLSAGLPAKVDPMS